MFKKDWTEHIMDWTLSIMLVCFNLSMIALVVFFGLAIYDSIVHPEHAKKEASQCVNDDSGSDMLTGFMIGNMLGSSSSSSYIRSSPSSSRSYTRPSSSFSSRPSFSSGGRR